MYPQAVVLDGSEVEHVKETTGPTAEEMMHPNPRGHRPNPGDSRTQSVRKARLAQRSHGESEDPERNTPISQVVKGFVNSS